MSESLFQEAHLNSIEKRLEELIPAEEGASSSLFEAVRYTLFAPSKRLRPLFVLAILEDYGIPTTHGLDPALALEMIHTYSLIHDDLPCMDDDDLRRGKPSLHTVYGEALALLAGDCLLTKAFEVIANAPYLSPSLRLNLIAHLSRNGGGEGMIEGQAIDLLFEGKKVSDETLLEMHRLKTAALFGTACVFGGMIAKRTEEEQVLLKKCGEAFGIGFQIVDDILDITGEESVIGKPRGSDVALQKVTFPSHYGLKRARELALSFFDKALEILSKMESPTPHLKELIQEKNILVIK